MSINAGGPAESNSSGGDNAFVADEDYGTAGTTYSVTNTITIPANLASIAAPAAVYQSARQGTVTYTIPGLTAGTNYTVRLHFAELYFPAAGDREFDVAINGTTVLTNFDIYATAGAQYTAVVEQYIATANSSGDIVIAFTNGALDQPMINGIEVLGDSSVCTTVPSAPTGLTATATSSSIIGLDMERSDPSSQLHHQLLQRLQQHYQRVHSVLEQPGCERNCKHPATPTPASRLRRLTTTSSKQSTYTAHRRLRRKPARRPWLPRHADAVPPTGPTGLTATASSSSAIGLSWTAAPANPPCTISSYNVYGSTTSGFTPSSSNLIASGVTGTTYTNTGLAASTTYYYLVEAVDADRRIGGLEPGQRGDAKLQRRQLQHGPFGADRTDSDGVVFERDRPELDGSNSTGELHHQFLQRLRQHDQRVHAVVEQPDRQRTHWHQLLRHRPLGFDDLLLRG